MRRRLTESLMNQFDLVSRRQALCQFGGGFGGLALGSLLGNSATAAARQSSVAPHYEPSAKAVIQLYMHGGPSHVDLLDPKPVLNKFDGKTPPAHVADDESLTKNLMGSPFRFNQCGESGLEFSEIQPFVSQHADEIAVIRSMFTEHRNHEQDGANRPDNRRPTNSGRMGILRTWNREPQFAGIRRVARSKRPVG